MQLLKPVWVSADGQAFMSIDIHPDGTRFATGGQGEDCGRVSIWNIKPILDEKAARDKDVSKLLTQMDHHLGCVNSVRWSNNGKFLASGGDDKLVMIWIKSNYGGGTIFGGGGKVHVESWRLHQTLRGHNGDVLDLAWGPGDGLLATASVDNSVIIWNADNLPEMIKILKGHTGLVKGVIFDPVGKFLASQSDDRTLRIWRTSDWSQDVVIDQPFVDSGATTHVLRPGWSPDGSMLVSAHAMNGGGPTAQIIDRGSWKTQRDFVGHKKAVTCTRFSNNLFQINNSKTGKPEIFVTIAMGSRDRSFSVWTTNLKRPLFVVNDVFDQSVLDLSWSRDGRLLLACSMDGTIAAVILTESEIGATLSQEKVQEQMISQYGKNIGKAALTKSIINAKSNGTSSGPKIIENPELLKANNNLDTMHAAVNGNTHNGLPSLNGSTMDKSENTSSNKGNKLKLYPKGPTDKQIEAKTSDGKRRITPIYIPPPSLENGDDAENNASINFGNAEFGSSSTQEKSKIAIELKNEIVTPNVSPGKFSNDNSNSLMSQRVTNLNTDYENEKHTTFSSVVNGQSDASKTASNSQTSPSHSKISSNAPAELPKEKETPAESDPTVNSIQSLVKRKPGPSVKPLENNTVKASTVESNIGKDDACASQKTSKRRAILSSSEDEDDESQKRKTQFDAHDDSSNSIKELESNTKQADFKQYGNSEKLKNLKMNKPDLISASKRPANAEEDTSRPKPKRTKTWNSEEKESSRPLASSFEVPSVIKCTSMSDVTIRLPPLKAYSSKIFNFQLNPSPATSLSLPLICQSDTQSTSTNTAAGVPYKVKATVSIVNNLVRLEGNTGVPGKLHQLICQIDNDSHQSWKVFFSSPITVVTSGNSLIVVACMDGSIHVFNITNNKAKVGMGEKLFPPLQLPSAISKLKVYKNRLAIITCCAHLYVWDLGEGAEKMKAVMKKESIEYLLQPGNIFMNEEEEEQEIEAIRVTKLSFTEPEGKVLIVTSAGKTFVFNADLGVWLKLADTYSWVQSASNYSSAVSSLPMQNDDANMPLASLSYNNIPNAPKLKSVSRETQRLASITHCQEQAVAALNLGSSHEYRFWYLKYIEHLAQGGMENISQIRGELSSLLRLSWNKGDCSQILGKIERTDLLKSSLKIIGGNLELQRVYVEYDEQMKCGWGNSSEDVKNVDDMLLDT